MKIKEIEIKRFGPLRNKKFKLSPALNIFFGGNESGKTSIVDLIAKELFKTSRGSGTRDITPFKGVERYRNEDFDGKILVEHEGKTYSEEKGAKKLKTEDVLGDILISKLLCIESGDLSVPKDSNFYDTIKDGLSGSKGGIDKIKKTTFAKAGLPASGENTKGSGFNNDFTKTKEDLNIYKDLLPNLEKIHDLEVSLEEVRSEIGKLKESRLTVAKQDFEEYSKAQKKLEDLDKIKEDDLKRITKLSERKNNLITTKETKDKGIQDLSNRIVDDEMIYNEKKTKLKVLKEKYASRLYLEFEEDFKRFVKAKDWVGRIGIMEQPILIAWIASFIVTLFSLVFVLIKGSGNFFVPFFFGALGTALFFLGRGLKVKIKEHETLKRRIKIQSTELKIPLSPDLENMDQDTLPAIKAEKDQLEGEVKALEENLKKLKEEIPLKSKDMEESSDGLDIIEKKIKEILDAAGLRDIGDLEQKVKDKNEINNTRSKKREALEKLLGPDETLWEKVVGNIDAEKTEKTYDPNLFDELINKEADIKDKLEALKKPFLQTGCESPFDIHQKIDSCEADLAKLEINLSAANICKDIFTEIDEERNKILSRVFEDGSSPIFKLLEKVIGKNRVEKILVKNGNLIVKTPDDEIEIDAFSRGAHDQLLFTFRLALLKSIFPNPHMLILDDPFLTSDEKRTKKLVEIINALLDENWQVLYFTFDPDIKKILSHDKKDLEVFQLEPLHT